MAAQIPALKSPFPVLIAVDLTPDKAPIILLFP